MKYFLVKEDSAKKKVELKLSELKQLYRNEAIELNNRYKVYTRKELVKLVDEVNEWLLKWMEVIEDERCE